jgi:GT2 family glycosyltransferase
MIVDVIILSKCTNADYFNVNLNCIHSLLESEGEITFNVILLESNYNFDRENFFYPFPNVKVVIPREGFNFNRFLNIGLRYTTHDWILFSNNDVIFHKNWLGEILNVKKQHPEIQSFCPFDAKSPYLKVENYNHKSHHIGYRVPVEFVGWCYLFERSVIGKLGQFDEQFDLYFQDNDLALMLKKSKILHAMVPSSFVEHLGGYTTGSYDASQTEKYKEDKEKFSKKWQHSLWHVAKNKLKRVYNLLSSTNRVSKY